MPTLKNKATPLFKDKLLQRVIYCSKVRLPYYLKQESTENGSHQRSTVKEIGLANEALLWGTIPNGFHRIKASAVW